MAEKMFNEFTPATNKDDWMNAVMADLKGKPYQKICHYTYDGFELEPYYRKEETEGLVFSKTLPGLPPFVRSGKKQFDLNKWDITSEIAVADVSKANTLIKKMIGDGVDGFILRFDSGAYYGKFCECTADGIVVNTYKDIEVLLEGINLSKVTIHIEAGTSNYIIFSMIKNYADKNNYVLKGSVDNDPLAFLSLAGKHKQGYEKMIKEGSEIVDVTLENENFYGVVVDTSVYHEAAATISQEIAFALATGVEYFSQLNEKYDPEKLAKNLLFTFSVGRDYLLEIAKFRAFRLLWSKVIKKFTGKEIAPAIHAKTGMWNKTYYDPYVNMLRLTSETMSGVLGAADFVTTRPFDKTYQEADEFSLRIAKNVQLLLKEESKFDKIVDPSAGSYYIETATEKIANSAWSIFQEIEKSGGMLNALKLGTITEMVEEVRKAKDKNIAYRKDIFIGTNQYPNPTEDITRKERPKASYVSSEDVKFDCDDVYSCIVKKAEASVSIQDMFKALYNDTTDKLNIKPFEQYRGSEMFEKIRLATEKSGKKIKAFMATMGNLTMRKARAGFSSNFLGAAGFECIDNNGFKTPQEAYDAYNKSGAEIVVVCSSDDEYATIGKEFIEKTRKEKPEAIIIVAGYPKAILDELKGAGADEFIHVKSDAVSVLTDLQKKLNII